MVAALKKAHAAEIAALTPAEEPRLGSTQWRAQQGKGAAASAYVAPQVDRAHLLDILNAALADPRVTPPILAKLAKPLAILGKSDKVDAPRRYAIRKWLDGFIATLAMPDEDDDEQDELRARLEEIARERRQRMGDAARRASSNAASAAEARDTPDDRRRARQIGRPQSREPARSRETKLSNCRRPTRPRALILESAAKARERAAMTVSKTTMMDLRKAGLQVPPVQPAPSHSVARSG